MQFQQLRNDFRLAESCQSSSHIWHTSVGITGSVSGLRLTDGLRVRDTDVLQVRDDE
jgi:hypothetical protein